jgi:hypothetical protein
VLNAKGGEIKGQSKWISQPLVNYENSRVRICISSKILLLQNLVSYGGEFWLREKGEFVTLDQFYSCNISLFAQTSVFDLETRKMIWFAKTNQVVAEVIQIC